MGKKKLLSPTTKTVIIFYLLQLDLFVGNPHVVFAIFFGLLFSISVCICDIFRNFRIEQSKQSRLFAHSFRCNREMHLPGGFAKWMDRLWPLGIGVQIESIAERPI